MEREKHAYNNKKNQSPSYCDRILYASAPGYKDCIELTNYQGHFGLMQSDHRAVSAAFQVTTTAPYMCSSDAHSSSSSGCIRIRFLSMQFKSEGEIHFLIHD